MTLLPHLLGGSFARALIARNEEKYRPDLIRAAAPTSPPALSFTPPIARER